MIELACTTSVNKRPCRAFNWQGSMIFSNRYQSLHQDNLDLLACELLMAREPMEQSCIIFKNRIPWGESCSRRVQNLLKKTNLHKILDSFAGIFKILKTDTVTDFSFILSAMLSRRSICICFAKSLTSLAALLT